MIGFFVKYQCVSPSVTPLASDGLLLHKVGWTLGSDSADLHFHPL